MKANDEQRARLARLAVDLDGWSRSDSAWLLALVKELDEENARNHQLRLDATRSSGEAHDRWQRAEQQLAAVTAERDAEVRANVGLMACNRALSAERDELKRALKVATDDNELRAEEISELKREVERLNTELFLPRTLLTPDKQASLFLRAEKAEAERDALQGIVSRCGSGIGAIEGRRIMGALEDVRWCSEQVGEMQARIADLEKQLAEQTKRAETAEQDTRDALEVAAAWEKDAEVAEKRVAELQALVDAATDFQFRGAAGISEASQVGDTWLAFRRNANGEQAATSRWLPRDEAIALARELAVKGPK